jgi:hypothetical protein
MLPRPVPVECLKAQALPASQRLATAILLCVALSAPVVGQQTFGDH